MTDFANIVLDFGNAVNLIAVLFLIRAIYNDRNILKGFSIIGALLTCLAISCFELAYLFLDNFLSFVLGLTTLVFWFMAFLFTVRNWVVRRKQKDAGID